MTYFKTPEIGAEFGALDDDAFADGEPLSAHILRQLTRNGNLNVAKGHMMFRWLGRNDGITGVRGTAVGYTVPFWRHLIPNAGGVLATKKFGLVKMRVRMRIYVESGYAGQIFIGTIGAPNPEVGQSANFQAFIGTGSIQTLTFEDIPVRASNDELLTFMLRSLPNITTDALLNTVTYGGTSSGPAASINGTIFDSTIVAGGWNFGSSNNMAFGGHYAYCLNAVGNVSLPPSAITNVLAQNNFAVDAPPELVNKLEASGHTYYIRKMPAFGLVSIACYAQDNDVGDYGIR